MRILIRLSIFFAGVLVLGAVGWSAAHYRPFSAAPTLGAGEASAARAAAGGRVAEVHVARQEDPRPWMEALVRGAETPPLTETENILLAGIDTRPWSFGGRTDALVVLVMDRGSGHVGLVSIPRDLMVVIPGATPDRINTVYRTGQRLGGAEHGAQLLAQVVQHTLGLPISQVVFVDHAGFEAMVDSLGGITVTVVCPIRDNFLDPRGPGGRLPLKLEAGVHHVDGKTALMFARSRHGRGIFDRARRQQAVLMGLRQRLLELGFDGLQKLLPALQQTVYTQATAGEILALARRLARVKPTDIHGLVLGPEQASPTILESGQWVMIPDPEAMHAALADLFRSKAPGHQNPATCPEMDAALH